MRAGIITFGSAHNYGALLQAWALQKSLENEGLDVDVINYRPPAIDNVYDIYRPPRRRGEKADEPRRIRRLRKFAKVNLRERWRIEKRDAFEHFINDVLNTTRCYRNLEELQAAGLDYDYLFAGSDQIWNTDLTKGFDPAFFLDFGNEDAVRIAYAASLGREEIDARHEELYRAYLQNYDVISVRERSMLPQFEELVDKPIAVAADPTLLLTREDFDSLKQPSKYAGSEYIYAHQIASEPAVVDFADYLSDELGLPVLHNRLEGAYQNELDWCYRETPERLLSVIENAQLILSNSFHMTVLAIIYHKPFITVPHIRRPERMKMLCEDLGLEDHLIEDVRLMPPFETLAIDYGMVQKRLVAKRDESVAFLKKTLEIVK